ncbi:PP2C family protein-serine/threonine phosphatase [Streptomyces sp. TR02-1]|uniref:PP2C family protein-serine/threonine phosphatase n=1 Tax=Streptomyces sp. TR02-1 TaxID=3385977 RepID=UPI0039A1227F
MDGNASVEHALRGAAPHQLVDVVTAALKEQYGASSVELYIADYAMRSLQPVGAPQGEATSLALHDSPEGRAFGAQEPHVVPCPPGRVTVHLPVTVRGDRTGVLSVAVPEDRLTDEVLGDLDILCTALGHEIQVAERDTDLFQMARRATRLTLAAEMQWQLLPGRACSRSEFTLGGHLEPAYAIFGDNFDWAVSPETLTLSVTNGMGDGIEAALLTSLAVNALRNARRAGLGIADQAALADQALYGQYGGSRYLSVLLMELHLGTGEMDVVEAGSPWVLRMRDGAVEPLAFDAQLPLGMFEETPYVTERLSLRAGDRLLITSDGVDGAVSPTGETYGEQALARSLAASRMLPAPQVPGALLHALTGHRGSGPLEDDALVVCLDWHGRVDHGAHPQPAPVRSLG